MLKLSFVALWAPCLAQVSKKLHFPILNLSLSKFHKYLSAATKPGPGVGAPIFGAGLLLSPCNMVPTRNCSADTSWVQSTENVRNLRYWFLRLPEFQPPLSAELPLLGGWPCHMAWSKHFEGYLAAFGIKVSFSFCPCCFLVVVWGKREILSLLRFRCSLDFFFSFSPPVLSLSLFFSVQHTVRRRGFICYLVFVPWTTQSLTDPAVLREGLVWHLVLFVFR